MSFIEIPKSNWPYIAPEIKTRPYKCFKNDKFLVQLFKIDAATTRITVNKIEYTMGKNGPIWSDGISWDDLQKIKSDLGFGHRDAVEIYPKDKDIVNVANMRHLFVLSDDQHNLNFIWRNNV